MPILHKQAFTSPNPVYAPHSPQTRPTHTMGVGTETPAPPHQPADQATKPQHDPSSASSSSLSKQRQRPQDDKQDEDMQGHEQQQQQQQEQKHEAGGKERQQKQQQEEEQQEEEPQQQEQKQRHSPSEGQGKGRTARERTAPPHRHYSAIQAPFPLSFLVPPVPQLDGPQPVRSCCQASSIFVCPLPISPAVATHIPNLHFSSRLSMKPFLAPFPLCSLAFSDPSLHYLSPPPPYSPSPPLP